jgi:hypothetical protein
MLIFYIEINQKQTDVILNLTITYPTHQFKMDEPYLKILTPLIYFPIVAFFVKVVIDAFASNVKATSSIVQYSLMILYLAISGGIMFYNLTKKTSPFYTNFKVFLFAMFWLLCNYIGIVALNATYIDTLNRGDLITSVNDPTISNWVLVPQMLLVFYNVALFVRYKPSPSVDPPVSWVTLTINALALIQMYLIVNSFRTMQTWLTDDATRNIPTPTPSA